jgi:hypothetical protein
MRSIRVALVAIGVAMMTFAVASAVPNQNFRPYRHGLFLIGVLVLDDGVLLPFFLLVGFLVRRFIRARFRPVVQGALIITAAVTFVALPFVLGFGRIPDNPSALPRNYPAGYLIVLVIIWAAAAAAITIRLLRRPPPPSPRRPPPNPVDHGLS